jgi:microcystin-dependent protein
MAQPYVGEIRMFAGNFAPAGWEFCNGQLLSISENETLFNLIGTTYGGDGQNTFALPNLQSRTPIHMGTGPGLSSHVLAESAGVESVTLTTQQIPAHTHPFMVSSIADGASPTNSYLAQTSQSIMYFADPPSLNMKANAIGSAGGSQPHDNMQPYLCISFIISLFGIFPSQT